MSNSMTLTVAAAIFCANGALAATPMRCSHQLPPQHDVALVIDRWADAVERLSEGEIDVQIFGAESLSTAKENIPAVAKGTIECAFSVNFQWGKTLPAMDVTLRPYAFADLDLWRGWTDSQAAAYLEDLMRAKGLENVAWLFQTNSNVFTSNDRFLVTPQDFQGVKMRGLSAAFDKGLAALGAATSSMPGSEVYQALATGVIDAAQTDVAAAYSRKYYEVQDHMVVTPVISVFFNGYVNTRFYDRLSETGQAALDQAGRDAAQWAIDAAETAMAAAPAKLEAEGVALHIATPEENAVLRGIMQPAFDAVFLEDAGKDVQRLLDLLDDAQG